MVKTCVKCSTAKEPELFYKSKNSGDGLSSYCKECQRKNLKGWRKRHPEKMKLSLVAYNKWKVENPEINKEARKKGAAKWKTNNPEKAKENSKNCTKNKIAHIKDYYIASILKIPVRQLRGKPELIEKVRLRILSKRSKKE